MTRCGYPISLQLQSQLALQVADSSIELYESRKGGKPPTQHFVHPQGDGAIWKAWTERCKPEQVPCWVHTPKVPLNKKLDMRDVLFCLPKEALDKNKTYQARVKLQIGGADPLVFVWEFTTGNAARDLTLK